MTVHPAGDGPGMPPGVLGFTLVTSRTLLEAMAVLARDRHLLSGSLEVSMRGEQVHLVCDAEGKHPNVGQDLAAVRRIIALLAPGTAPLPQVCAADDRSPGRLVLARATMVRPLPRPDAVTQGRVDRFCEDVVDRHRPRAGLPRAVRSWIIRHVGSGAAMSGAGAALGVSERTLRRHLSEAGTTYRTLLDEARQALAGELLASGVVDVEGAAWRLGYTDSSAFVHAFRRWHGSTPAQWQGGPSTP